MCGRQTECSFWRAESTADGHPGAWPVPVGPPIALFVIVDFKGPFPAILAEKVSMKPITTVLLAGLLVSGCVHRHYAVVEPSVDPAPDIYGAEEPYVDDQGYADEAFIYEEESEPFWDGHAFIVVASHAHGRGCGHWYHHGCWHLFPEHHDYTEFG